MKILLENFLFSHLSHVNFTDQLAKFAILEEGKDVLGFNFGNF